MQGSAERDSSVPLVQPCYTAAGKCYCCPDANPCSPADGALMLLKGLIKLCSHPTQQSQPASSLSGLRLCLCWQPPYSEQCFCHHPHGSPGFYHKQGQACAHLLEASCRLTAATSALLSCTWRPKAAFSSAVLSSATRISCSMP